MRVIVEANGLRWKADIVSHGRTSGYLHRRVHRPIVQFECLDRRLARRYAPLPVDLPPSLEGMADDQLLDLLQRAAAH